MRYFFGSKGNKAKSIARLEVAKQENDEVTCAGKQKKILLAVPEPKKMTRRKLVLLSRRAISMAKSSNIKDLAFNIAEFSFASCGLAQAETAQLLATNFEMANYEFNKYKSKPKHGWRQVNRIFVHGNLAKGTKQAFSQGKTIGQAANIARDLANTPGGEMTPALLASNIKKLFKGQGVRIKVLKEKQLKKKKMGGILSVGQGSKEQSHFIILEYSKGRKSEKPVVLVGKAITFDTGGINLKPSQGGFLHEMHMDMSGGAAVAAALWAAAKLKVKKNIVVLIPAAENMASGSSYRPGDIIRMMDGRTVEIGNTDAEGRIILADALTYAKKYKPRIVVDVATLTGAAMVSLGYRASAIMSGDEKLHDLFKELGEQSGDYVWPLPLWEEFEDEVKGQVGDINNIGKYEKIGGAITAGAFLYQFAKDYPWVHIDMAPKMTSIEGEHLAKGAAGAPVRLLVELLRNFGKHKQYLS